jgi:hypothetical protein
MLLSMSNPNVSAAQTVRRRPPLLFGNFTGTSRYSSRSLTLARQASVFNLDLASMSEPE